MPTTVSFLPSLPSEGWVSMNRYWDALARAAEGYTAEEFSFQCPLPQRGICTGRAGRFRLALEKKITYPLRIGGTVRSGIAHILDHSYAFLIPSVPKRVRTIVTVHDLLPLREPDGLNAKAISRFRQRVEWVKSADLVLSDSIATQSDLIDLIGADPGRIRVLPLGADTALNETKEAPRSDDYGDYLFSIGGYMKRKNLEILPRVLELVRQSHPHIRLVRAGGKLPDSLTREFATRCGAGTLVELGRVSDERLASLYRSAVATIIPSRYEGFGLPVLEAMARECPVVSARTTSLPEVGGDAALYFEVDDADDAAGQVLKILNATPDWLLHLKQLGTTRARQFTWGAHFDKLLAIYREVATMEPMNR